MTESCDICKLVFDNTEDHLYYIANNEICLECGETFRNDIDLKFHKQIHIRLICSQCHEIFTSEVAFANHMAMHKKAKESSVEFGNATTERNTIVNVKPVENLLNVDVETYNNRNMENYVNDMQPAHRAVQYDNFANVNTGVGSYVQLTNQHPEPMELTGHILNRNKVESSVCNEYSPQIVDQTTKISSNGKKSYCKICKKNFSNSSDHEHEIYILKHSIIIDYKRCLKCDMTFSTNKELRLHERINKHILYPCEDCHQMFNTHSARRRHVKRKHRGKKKNVEIQSGLTITEENCDENILDSRNVEQPIVSNLYQCSFDIVSHMDVQDDLIQQKLINDHSKSAQPENIDKVNPNCETTSVNMTESCDICKLVFDNTEDHLYYIANNEICLECGETFGNNIDFKFHKQIHIRLICSQCHEIFTSEVAFANHMAMHKKEENAIIQSGLTVTEENCDENILDSRNIEQLVVSNLHQRSFDIVNHMDVQDDLIQQKLINDHSKSAQPGNMNVTNSSCETTSVNTTKSCDICKLVFDNTEDHLSYIANNEICLKCGETFDNNIDLKFHKQIHIRRICLLCHKIFTSERAFRNHMTLHKKANQFTVEFVTERNTMINVRPVENLLNVNVETYNNRNMENNVNDMQPVHKAVQYDNFANVNTGVGSYVQVTNQHPEPMELTEHILNKNKAENSVCNAYSPQIVDQTTKISSNGKKSYCTICKKNFSNASDCEHEIYIIKHSIKINYNKCLKCNMAFSTNKELRLHELINKHILYPCEYCHQMFNTHKARRRHVKKTHRKKEVNEPVTPEITIVYDKRLDYDPNCVPVVDISTEDETDCIERVRDSIVPVAEDAEIVNSTMIDPNSLPVVGKSTEEETDCIEKVRDSMEPVAEDAEIVNSTMIDPNSLPVVDISTEEKTDCIEKVRDSMEPVAEDAEITDSMFNNKQ